MSEVMNVGVMNVGQSYFANNLSTQVQVGIEDGSLYFADAMTDLGPS